MPINYPQTDVEFNLLLIAAGTTPFVVDFYADWCNPCQVISPIFEELSHQYTNLKFAKINTDKLKETAVKYRVVALPTFLVFLNGQTMDVITGANPDQLKNLIQKWSKNCPTQAESPVIGQIPLSGFIDKAQSECLNENDKYSLQAFFNGSSKLVSDVDEQLIINFRFTQPVKIHTILIKGEGEKAPKDVLLFINNPVAFDFDRATSTKPTQSLRFTGDDDLKSLYYVKFQNVNSLQIFVENNKEGSDKTIIERLELYGTPLKATNMQDFQRVAGKAGEAGH